MSGNALVTDDCPVCRGPAERPADVLAALSAMPEMLARAIEDASGRGDGWDARFVAVHLADLEVSRGWRFRQILAEDDPEIGVLDQDAYAERLQYSERSLPLALETFASNRLANLELLQQAGDEARSRTYRHVVFGKMTLGQLINHTAHHDRAHLRQIRGDSA